MDCICLRKPPIILDGYHILGVKDKGIFRNNLKWEKKYFSVLGDTLTICDNEDCMITGDHMIHVKLEDIEIVDKSRKNKSVMRIEFKNGIKLNDETHADVTFKDKELFTNWIKKMQYARGYWIKKQSIPDSAFRNNNTDSNEWFQVDLTLYNGVTASVNLNKSVKFERLVKVVNNSGFCMCEICYVDKDQAQLFTVTEEGKIQLVKESEEVFQYHDAGCRLFLMDRGKSMRLLVIFFEDDDNKSTFVACTAHKNITAEKVPDIPYCREKLRSHKKEDIALYFINPVEDIQLSGGDKVFDFFYDKHGTFHNLPGKLLIRKNGGFNKSSRSKTISVEDNRILRISQLEALRRMKSQKIKEVKEELAQNKATAAAVSVDSLSSSPSASECSFTFEGFGGDPNSCMPEWFNPNIKTQFDESSGDDSSSASIEGYDLQGDDELPPPSDTNAVDETQPKIDDNQEAEKNEELVQDIPANINRTDENSTEIEKDVQESDVVDNEEAIEAGGALNTTQEMINLYQECVLETKEEKQDQQDGLKVKEDYQSTAIEDKVPDIESTEVKSNDDCINEQSSQNNNTDEPIVVERPPSKKLKQKASKCQLCNTYDKNKPFDVKTVYVLKAYESYNDLYICLNGVHLRKKGQQWLLADGCSILKGLDDLEWVNAKQTSGTVEMSLGVFHCLYIPSGRQGYWIVRQELLDHSEGQATHDEEMPAPTVVCADVPEDKVIETTKRDVQSSLEDSVEIIVDSERIPPLDSVGPRRVSFKATTDKLRGQVLGTIKSVPGMIKKGEEMIDKQIKQLVDKEAIGQDDIIPDSERATILQDEFVLVGERYLKPLKDIIFKICTQMESVSRSEQYKHGDDFENVSIGWEIRGEFCTLLANLFRIGLTEEKSVLKSFFSEQKPPSLWDVVREFSLAFEQPEFNSVVKSIKAAKMSTDDERFRAFVCQLLNRSKEDGTEKLIVMFFQLFPFITNKLAKFYLAGSFWRMTYSSGFGIILDEIILSMKHFNGWPFNLHLDFEYRFCPRPQPTSRARVEESLVFF